MMGHRATVLPSASPATPRRTQKLRRAALLRRHDHERGFAIGAILFILTMVGVGGAVLYSGYSQILRTNIEITRDNAAKNDLLAAARTLSATSAMINGGLNLQPPAVLPFASADAARLPGGYANAGATGAPNTVGVMQAAAGTRQLDPWNRYYIYCRWENASSPGTDPALLLITAGPDGMLNTGCGDVVAQNDDRIELLSVAQAVDRANVWQYQPISGGAQVQFGITGNAVQVTNQGDISANSLNLAGALNLGTPLAIAQGGTGASGASGARANLGAGTTGDALFMATTPAGARGTLGSTTVGDALFVTANAGAARTTLGAGALGSNLFTAGDAATARATLGASGIGDGMFIAADAAAARNLLEASSVGEAVFTATSAAAARSALGAGTVGDAVFAAGTGAVARAAIGAGATGDAVFAAANPTSALTALGLIGGSSTLDIGITGTANTAIYLADGGNILAGTVPIARGGTSAGDAAAARNNLGADNAGNLTSGTLSWTRLPTSGVTAGSYNWGTVNQYGLVEAAQNVATNSLSQNNSGIVVNDTTPGIGTDGQIVFTLEGDTKALMDYRGFLGLATTAPQDRLHIAGGTDGNSALRLEGANNTERFIRFATDAGKRWELGADDAKEDSKDVGSDFVIRNFDDAGTLLGTPFSIERATGNVTFNGTVTATNFVGGGAGSNIALGASTAATNPARSDEVTTGLFSPATGVVAVANNGAESLRVAANGNVGIGTATPNSALSFAATGKIQFGNNSYFSSNGAGIFYLGYSPTSSDAVLSVNYLTDTRGMTGGYISSGANVAGTALNIDGQASNGNAAGGAIVFRTTPAGASGAVPNAWVEAMRVTSDGRLGIGTTAPNTLLSLSPTNGNQAKITLWEASTTQHYGFGITAGQLNYDTLGAHVFYLGGKNGNGTELMRVDTTGLGIGKSPATKLDVNGAIGIGGVQALQLTSSGNPILGNTAMSPTLAPLSIGIGRDALAGVTAEVSSVALGHQALATAATATNNTAVGYRALNLGTGGSNTALGYNAMAVTTTGANNTGIGTFALLAQNQGSANVALGRGALSSVTSGNNNLGLGYSVGSTVLTNGSNNILIGTSNAVTTPAAGTNNWISIGNQFVSNWATTGSEAIGLNRNTTGTPGTTALIVGTGASNGNGAQLTAAGVWTNASDRRIKEAIQPLGYGLDAVMRLRPVSYTMKDSHVPQIGFIAQEVESIVPEVVVRPGNLDDPSQHYTLAYGNMVAVAVKAIQELKAENDNLRHEMAALRAGTPASPVVNPGTAPAWYLSGFCIVLLLGLSGLGMMLVRLRREVRRLQKVV